MKAPINQVVRTEASAIRNVCVYCGSGGGGRSRLCRGGDARSADFWRTAGIRLVYGGGSIGLMGAVARAVIDDGGSVTGIIPQFLQNRELMLNEAQDLVVMPRHA